MRIRLHATILALAGTAAAARAQTPDTSCQTRLDSLIGRGVREQRGPRLAVGMVRDGRLAYAR